MLKPFKRLSSFSSSCSSSAFHVRLMPSHHSVSTAMCVDRRLCFILPADSGEIKPYQLRSPTKKEARHHRILAYIRHLLCRFGATLKWRVFKMQVHQPEQVVFYDAAGADFSHKVGSDNPRIFSFAELYIGSDGFSEKEVLGSGGFGKVYRAILPSDGTVVAVKCLAERGERFEKTFAAELVAVAHLRHRNLVRLRGWCVHEDKLLLVYDYMPNRSLDRVLFRRAGSMGPEVLLSWEQRQRIVSGLAAALHYLHEQLETRIIHRDVKTSNVMLDSRYNARLGDFGLARWLEHELEFQTKTPSMRNHQFRLAETTRIGGTIGYLPPESFQKRSTGTTATTKSDVFGFGIVVLEVVSGRRAVDLTYPDDQIILLDYARRLSDEGRLLQVGDTRLADGSYRLAEMEQLIRLGLLCTLHDPNSRPNMKWVAETLSGGNHGELPALPSFQSHPLYISMSSQTNTSTGSTAAPTAGSTATTVTTSSSNYFSAAGETIYTTAEMKNSDIATSDSSHHGPTTGFPNLETPREISYNEIVSATNNFSDTHRVAEVDFGTAYQGILSPHQHVLVKRLGMKTCPALRARFSNELQNLGRLRHRNLVQLRGWCTEQGEMLVVYDYSASQLLSHLLFHQDHKDSKSILQWNHRYSIIKSLAAAILYLHEEWDEQVIHRNITSSAVILDPDMNPRLGSFALAEFLTRNEHGHQTVNNGAVRGIFGYMSPDYVESGGATASADIYSFGVVVLEMVSGQMAVDFRQPEVLLVKRVREFERRNRPLEELAK